MMDVNGAAALSLKEKSPKADTLNLLLPESSLLLSVPTKA